MTDTPMAEVGMAALAAEIRRQAADINGFATFVSSALSDALPVGFVKIDRPSRSLTDRLRGRQPFGLTVSVRLGVSLFRLYRSDTHRRTAPSISYLVDGIPWSSGPRLIEPWSEALAGALVAEAEHNAKAASAIHRITSLTA